MSQFAIQFNKNSFSFSPAQPQLPVVMPQQSGDASLALTVNPALVSPPPFSNAIQIAVKNNVSVFYFQMIFPVHLVFTKPSPPSKDQYISTWKSIAEEHIRDLTTSVIDSTIAQKKLEANNYIYMANRKVQQVDYLYFFATLNNIPILLELQIGGGTGKTCIKTTAPELIPFIEHSVNYALAH